MQVFVGGSRRVSRLSSEVKGRIDRMIDQNMQILVGDANGADKALQVYLAERGYRNVVVFCTAGECRNNIGTWHAENVTPPHPTRDFEFFTAKDAVMARQADAALMLWDGESSGTMVNVARMVARQKIAVVYISPLKSFATVRSRAQFEAILSECAPSARRRIDEYISHYAQEYAQPSVFSA